MIAPQSGHEITGTHNQFCTCRRYCAWSVEIIKKNYQRKKNKRTVVYRLALLLPLERDVDLRVPQKEKTAMSHKIFLYPLPAILKLLKNLVYFACVNSIEMRFYWLIRVAHSDCNIWLPSLKRKKMPTVKRNLWPSIILLFRASCCCCCCND
jgi:hypothetical protein